MKFRKKPIVIEAIQYDGKNRDSILVGLGMPEIGHELESETAYLAGVAPPVFSLIISTLEGDMKAHIGDWIIKGINGEFYPCKDDIFEKTYEAV